MSEITWLIPLTQGKIAVVSTEDYEWALQFSWFAAKKVLKNRVLWRAQRSENRSGTILTFYMHREIAVRMGLADSEEVDHWDLDGLNNQRRNLRPTGRFQNACNRTKRINCTSQFKGVSWIRAKQKWVASIKAEGRGITLGAFNSEIEAALAYDSAARIYFGEFARLNFPTANEVGIAQRASISAIVLR